MSTSLTYLDTRHLCMTQIALADVLDIVITEAKRFPTFRLVMGAHVEKLIEEEGVIWTSYARILSHLPFRDTTLSRLLTLGIWQVHIKDKQHSR